MVDRLQRSSPWRSNTCACTVRAVASSGVWLITATERSSYPYWTCRGSFATFAPNVEPFGSRNQSNRFQCNDGHALLSIHWISPVEPYLFRENASNIARSFSYAMTWALRT